MSMAERRYPNYKGSHAPKHKELPFLTEARLVARMDALKETDRERVHREAQEAAALIMQMFERRNG